MPIQGAQIHETRRPTGPIILPEISREDFLEILQQANWNIEAAKRRAGIPHEVPSMTVLRRYGVVREFTLKLKDKLSTDGAGVQIVSTDLGVNLSATTAEVAARIRCFPDADLDTGITEIEFTPTKEHQKEEPIPTFSREQLLEAAASVNWNLEQLKERLGVKANANVVEIFANTGTADILKQKFTETLRSRNYVLNDAALDLNANSAEVLTLLLVSKNEIAAVERFSKISELNSSNDLVSNVNLVSNLFGGLPLYDSLPRCYSSDVLKLLVESNWDLSAFKENLGIKGPRPYFDIFQHYCVLPQLKTRVTEELEGTKWKVPRVAVKLGISCEATKKLIKSLDIPFPEKCTDDEVRDLVRKELDNLFAHNVLYLSTRYSVNVRSLIWNLVGYRLKGRYNQEMLKKIVDEQILAYVNERAEIECGTKKRTRKIARTKEPEVEGRVDLDFNPSNLTQEDIVRISKQLDDGLKREARDKATNALIKRQAFVILKELEEKYIFRRFSTAQPGGFTVDAVLRDIETAKREANPLLQTVLADLADDIEHAGSIQEKLWKIGLKKKTTLNLYQLVAVHRMWKNQRFVLADEMGLGKTLETLCTFLYSGKREALILGPRASLKRWMDDLTKHTDLNCELVLLSTESPTKDVLESKNISLVTFPDTESRCKYLLERQEVPKGKRRIILMNYEVLEDLHQQRTEGNPSPPPITVSFLGLDEVHNLKKASGVRAQAIFGTGNGDVGITAEDIVAITATPIENKGSDVIAVMQYLAHGRETDPELLFTTHDLRELSALLTKSTDLGALSLLRGYLLHNMIRRLSDEVISGLPRKVITTVKVDPYEGVMELANGTKVKLDGDYRTQICFYEMALRNPIEFEQFIKSIGHYKPVRNKPPDEEEDTEKHAQIIRLQQVADDPSLFVPGSDSIKFDAIKELVRERISNGKSVLIFFNNNQLAASNLTKVLGEAFGKGSVAHIDGTVDQRVRVNLVDDFQNKKVPILVATIETAGASIELTQADTIILANCSWKPSTIEQGIGRARRIDDKRNYEGRELEVIHMEYEHPTTPIDHLKGLLVAQKRILVEMIANGNLSPEVLAALGGCDASIIRAVEEAVGKPAHLELCEITAGERLRLIIDRIIEARDRPELVRELWHEAAIVYAEFLEHKGTFYANMANLDILSGEMFPDLKGRVLNVLDAGCATSTLYQAYKKKENNDDFRDSGFCMDIYDFDIDPLMLALGVPRKDRQSLGTFSQLSQYPENFFDVVNISYAWRYAESPAQLIIDIRRILKPGGKLTILLPKDNTITETFESIFKLARFRPYFERNTKLHSKLDAASYREFCTKYGKDVADDIAREAHTEVTYFVAEIDKDNPINEDEIKEREDEIRIEKLVPQASRDTIEKIKTVARHKTKNLNLPRGASVEGRVTMSGRPIHTNGERKGRNVKSILEKLNGIGRLASICDAVRSTSPNSKPDEEDKFEGMIKVLLTKLKEELERAQPTEREYREIIDKFGALETSDSCKKWFNAHRGLVEEIKLSITR